MMSTLPFGFLTDLSVKKIAEADSNGRATWVLLRDLAYHSQMLGLIVVSEGFETDFASVPRAPLVYWLAGDTAHKSAVIHDYLVRVQHPKGRATWKQCTAVFAEAMKHEGVPLWRRKIMEWGVAGADPAKRIEDVA